MTGWRVGYSLAPPAWTREMLKVQGHTTTHPNSMAQRAAAEAFDGAQDSVQKMLIEYTKRRDWLLSALSDIPGICCAHPEGAFYAFPNVRELLGGEVKTSGEFANKLLMEEHTVVTDGAGFGAEGFIRISYATSLDRLQEGIKRIRRVAEGLVSNK
jgi:aspartate aminotransferase